MPDEVTDPELYELVKRYQMHKCSNYCKRKYKVGKGKHAKYVTRCKFNFPRPTCEKATLHCVEEKLKARRKIYDLTRSEVESRINDYNPLLLMLWIDIQYVAESSLALAHYLTSYVTKAEKGTMQEIWEDISNNLSI